VFGSFAGDFFDSTNKVGLLYAKMPWFSLPIPHANYDSLEQITGKNSDNWFDIWKLGRLSEVYTFNTNLDILISYILTSELVIRY
jgi:hypothetical protein